MTLNICNNIIYLILFIKCLNCYVLTENQILEDIKFLSQTNDDGIKPSRLRTLLLADLKTALQKQQPIQQQQKQQPQPQETNCTSVVNLKVTPNCTCATYSCANILTTTTTSPTSMMTMMMNNHGKRSRIQRSCEDYCCRRTNNIRKSLLNSALYDVRQQMFDNCEIPKSQLLPTLTNLDIGGLSNGHHDDQPFKQMPWIVQIYSRKSKVPICLGSLIHPKIVITTLVCAGMQQTSIEPMRIKMRETVDKYQYRYQVRNVTKQIITDNYPELFEKFGFNIALLILNKEIDLSNDIRTTCLPSQTIYDSMTPDSCFIDSLENKNGRIIERREPIRINQQCINTYNKDQQQQQRRQIMLFPKSNICMERISEQGINGASLFCLYELPNGMGYRYVQHGIVAWSTVLNRSPNFVSNTHNFKNWIDKNLKILELM